MEILRTDLDSTMVATLVAILLVASIYDIKTHKIPNPITLLPILFSASYYTVVDGMPGLSFSVLGMITGICLLIIPYMMGGMGAGDVKLMGAVGSFLGAKATFGAFILIALAGGVYSFVLILLHRNIFKGFFSETLMVLSNMVLLRQCIPVQTERSGQKPRIKYGVAIAFGTITYLLLKSLGFKFFA